MIKLVFMGTPEFSAKILEGIFNDGYDVIGVITEPDKPTGRDMKVASTPVKRFATEKGIKVYQPEKKIGVTEAVKELNPDICVVAAYGKIITKETLEIPKYGCINFHVSLLPELRGPSPIQYSILLGLPKTGVTIMIMDEGMDTGPILTQIEIPIEKSDTSTSIQEKLLDKGLPLLLQTIPEYIDGSIKPQNQEDDKATYCKMIEKEDGHIDFNRNAEEEERKIRAFDVWPGVFTFWNGKRIKILEIEDIQYLISNIQYPNYEPGEVFLDENKNLCLAFAKGFWIVKRLQMEGKKEMSAKDFMNGNKDFIGAKLS